LIKRDSKSKTTVEPELLAEANMVSISPIPRVTEKIKWKPTAETDADTGIFDSVDEFIELPVEEIIQQLKKEQRTGTVTKQKDP
jgi:hypothetical protein